MSIEPSRPCECGDREAVRQLMLDYAHGVDTNDWSLFRALFDSEVRLDFSALSGVPATVRRTDEWISYLAAMFGSLRATQHVVTNQRVAVTGSTADVTAYVTGYHIDQSGECCIVSGRYTVQARRGPTSWQATAVAFASTWVDGDPTVLDRARAVGSKVSDQK